MDHETPLPELFDTINRTVARYSAQLPESQRPALENTLLGLAPHMMLPPLRKRIDANGMVKLDIVEGVSITSRPGSLAKFLDTPVEAMTGSDEERDEIFSAVTEVAIYKALAAHATKHGERDGRTEMVARDLAAQVGELDRRVGAKLDTMAALPEVVEQQPEQRAYFTQLNHIIQNGFAERFAAALPEPSRSAAVG